MIKKIIEKIHDLSRDVGDIKIMHVCGSHEHTICKYGIRDVLPNNISLIPGPGCPVCVTTQKEIDTAIYLSENYSIITLGDLYRVPGSYKSLAEAKAEGKDIRIVYSIADAVRIAKKEKDKNFLFVAIGFETTAPTTAAELISLKNRDINNFFILNCHRQIPPVMEFLLEDSKIDAFICPGHVSTIIGLKPYYKLLEKYKVPMVVAGFEAIDILLSILMILRQIVKNDIKVENEYKRAVRKEGNRIAQKVISKVFEDEDKPWRGFPIIKNGGYKLKEEFKKFDIFEVEDIPEIKERIPKGCICDKILRGEKLPTDCPLFGKKCTPLNPIGSCMVSEEGTCRIFYKYKFTFSHHSS
ncbi:hydrogenase isoenzymes formation protein HypD [Methanocaldococcus villosus KIN24-T80]|uniref:Hydrogenase isoenzymes formation protein HypD n=1 Tax=Methanocaldococcus villosus KIN24-T80 TaxID=1069083 RepID=N6UV18_9EURY|nr:hydrogenase formation protein HypD [Methanocaldococcus villosus]ENN96209.1 hydrogenase isoenzymes formation protein HypD [Methanocaldococcus villosus KIN24-T80]